MKFWTNQLLATAIIRKAFGLDGYVIAESLSDELEHFASLKKVFIKFSKSSLRNQRMSDGCFDLADVKVRKKDALFKFVGIDDRLAAMQFIAATVLVPREEAATLYEGEFYVSDICGCTLVCDGVEVGKIINIVEGGGSCLLELTETDTNRLVYIPFNKKFIGKIDLEESKIQLMHRWILD